MWCVAGLQVHMQSLWHSNKILGETWEKVLSGMYVKRILRSTQSDLSLRCTLEETLHPWLSNLRPGKIPIRQRECACWSESSLSAHVSRYVFVCGSCQDDSDLNTCDYLIIPVSLSFQQFMLQSFWAVFCEKKTTKKTTTTKNKTKKKRVSSGICGHQSPRWILQIVWIKNKDPDDTLRMHRMIWIRTFCVCSKVLFSLAMAPLIPPVFFFTLPTIQA